MAMKLEVCCVDTEQGPAYVIDSALDDETLLWIDRFRTSLPLDSKRPTVDRRFFADGPQKDTPPGAAMGGYLYRPSSQLLETAIERSLLTLSSSRGTTIDNCHVFRYQRFLEYTNEGSKLDPHTDGTKVCDDTGLTSTHTLLLYLTDCLHGGETVLLKQTTKDIPQDGDKNIIYAAKPKRGMILLFPHAAPHAGATIVSFPKICLRAEVSLSIHNNQDLH